MSSYEIGDYIYFFFREPAIEYINCGKVNTVVSKLMLPLTLTSLRKSIALRKYLIISLFILGCLFKNWKSVQGMCALFKHCTVELRLKINSCFLI